MFSVKHQSPGQGCMAFRGKTMSGAAYPKFRETHPPKTIKLVSINQHLLVLISIDCYQLTLIGINYVDLRGFMGCSKLKLNFVLQVNFCPFL